MKIPAAMFALLPCAAAAAQITSQDMPRPEGPRHYLVAAPQQPAPGKLPLVIVLHGHAGSASLVFGKERLNAPMQHWLSIVDRDNVLVIAPDGMKGSDNKRGWNDCRADADTNPQSDDTGFLGALIDKAVADYNADPARVYIMGTSNGGGMAFRAGVELAPRVAGIAAIAALWPARSLCATPSVPMPALVVHGTDDSIAPYGGGEVRHWMLRSRGSGISAEQSVALWRKAAGLPEAPAQDSAFEHRPESGDSRAHRYVWGSAPQDVQVEFIKVEKGGHTEPSVAHQMGWLAGNLLGKQNADFESAEEAWRFFRDKRR